MAKNGKQKKATKPQPWAKKISSLVAQAEFLLKSLDAARRVCILAVILFAGLAGTPYYLSLKPRIELRVAGDKEAQPISIGWGRHHLIFDIENDSSHPIRIRELSVGFTPTDGFTLIPSTAHFAILQREETHDSMFSIAYSSIPFPSKGQDLESSVIYDAAKSTIPFRITFHVRAELDEAAWRHYPKLVQDWLPIPSRKITKTFEFRPEGRKTSLIIFTAHKNRSFEIFGPKLSIPSHIITNDPNFREITCYSMTEGGTVAVQKYMPTYLPKCVSP